MKDKLKRMKALWVKAKKRSKSAVNNSIVYRIERRTRGEKAILYEKDTHVIEERDPEFYVNMPLFFISKEIISSNRKIKCVLDIGCNAGQADFLLAKEYPDIKFIGMDFNRDAIEYARKTYSLPNLEFHTFDAIERDYVDHFSETKIDLITCFDVIEHLFPDQLTSVFENINNISHSNTISLFLTPHGHESDNGRGHVQFFDAKKLEKILAKHFKVERVGRYRYNPKLDRYQDILFATVYKK